MSAIRGEVKTPVTASSAMKSYMSLFIMIVLPCLNYGYIIPKELSDDLIWCLVNMKLQLLFCADQELEPHVLPLEANGATNAT